MSVISTKLLRKARHDAKNAKTFTPCVSCTAYGHRCDGSRPCSKCAKYSRQCVRPYIAPIEHPVICTSTHIRMNRNGAQDDIMISLCNTVWAQAAISRQRRLGFFVDDFVKSLYSVPAIHHHSISESLDSARAYTAFIISKSKNQTKVNEIASASALNVSSRENADNEDVEHFMSDNEVGFVSVTFDPATGQRVSIVANAQMARNLPMSYSQMLRLLRLDKRAACVGEIVREFSGLSRRVASNRLRNRANPRSVACLNPSWYAWSRRRKALRA
jgi:hypothetical protein